MIPYTPLSLPIMFFFPILWLGLRIIGVDGPLTLGANATLNCTSNLPIMMAEWLYSGIVIVTSFDADALLEIPAVNDSLHGREYVCRVKTPYGVQLKNTTIVVSGSFKNYN